jgi:hypothetical protein
VDGVDAAFGSDTASDGDCGCADILEYALGSAIASDGRDAGAAGVVTGWGTVFCRAKCRVGVALHEVLRPDLHRLQDGGLELLNELAIETEVVLRCLRTGRLMHAGDRQVSFGFSSYLIDAHKRKDSLRGKHGRESTRETYDSQPTARRLIVTSRMA